MHSDLDLDFEFEVKQLGLCQVARPASTRLWAKSHIANDSGSDVQSCYISLLLQAEAFTSILQQTLDLFSSTKTKCSTITCANNVDDRNAIKHIYL